ncbi:succinylglutamate desuccinylase/aspartoacylase family protein [Candidatus Gracilibacteria bacterium]|nr:succinylglutamate desuccinylase/aspartoacylase family protein [Candidatus Gracilibacteria bacterium]
MEITNNYLNISNSILLDTKIPGPTITIFSGIHGDEISGIIATKKFFEEVIIKKIPLLKGKIILVLGANEEAIIQKKRYIKTNLNRLFGVDKIGCSYEYERSRELMSLLNKSDFLLDLHSTSGPSIPFLFSERRNFEIAEKLGVPHVVVGWNDLGAISTAGDTENYMNKKGGWGFTFEAGNHDNPDGTKNAYQVLLNFLSHLGIINISHFQSLPGEKTFIEMTSVYTCKTGEFEFKLKQLENFSPLKSGTLIGMDGDEEIRAKSNCTLVMPSLRKIKKGEDAFFIAKILN